MNATLATALIDATYPVGNATERQAKYIAALMGVPADKVADYVGVVRSNRTTKEASARIKELLAGGATPVKSLPVTATAPKTDSACQLGPKFVSKGEWHILDGKLYLVVKSQSSGYLYAKQRIIGGSFATAKGKIFELGASTRVTADNAAEIKGMSEQHGSCVFCSKDLDLPESRTAGYGRKCADNNNLPWGN